MARRYFIVNLRLDELKLIEVALSNTQFVASWDLGRVERLREKIHTIRERIEARQAKDRKEQMKSEENYNA